MAALVFVLVVPLVTLLPRAETADRDPYRSIEVMPVSATDSSLFPADYAALLETELLVELNKLQDGVRGVRSTAGEKLTEPILRVQVTVTRYTPSHRAGLRVAAATLSARLTLEDKTTGETLLDTDLPGRARSIVGLPRREASTWDVIRGLAHDAAAKVKTVLGGV